MNVPEYYPYDQPDAEPALTYIQHIKEDMEIYPPRRDQEVDPLFGISHAIGRICQWERDGERIPAQKHGISKVYRAIDKLTETSKSRDEIVQARLLFDSVSFIKSKDSPERRTDRQAIQHRHVIRGVNQALQGVPIWRDFDKKYSEDERLAVGSLAHFTALGMMTRLQHPRLLALPALPHQDHRHNGSISANFDILVVEQPRSLSDIDESSEGVVHKVQVKSACFGSCSREDNDISGYSMTRVNRERRTSDRLEQRTQQFLERYAPDICLVSGCCDLGLRQEGGRYTTTTADLLVAEYEGRASEADILALDAISNGLLLTVTGDESRRGKATRPVPRPGDRNGFDKAATPVVTAAKGIASVFASRK